MLYHEFETKPIVVYLVVTFLSFPSLLEGGKIMYLRGFAKIIKGEKEEGWKMSMWYYKNLYKTLIEACRISFTMLLFLRPSFWL